MEWPVPLKCIRIVPCGLHSEHITAGTNRNERHPILASHSQCKGKYAQGLLTSVTYFCLSTTRKYMNVLLDICFGI